MKLKKTIFLVVACLLTCSVASAQKLYAQEYPLWEGGNAPTSNGITTPEVRYVDHVDNVSEATITLYVPERSCGIAVLACPGGAYENVWDSHEGHQMAWYYMNQGITLAVLKYRKPCGQRQIVIDDVQQAMRFMRAHAQEWGYTKVGVQGCSAGGHLASTAATHYVDAATRPDFQILLYPVITMDKSFTHMQTRENFLGKNPSQELVDMFSNEKQVTADTPPAFIAHSSDDVAVPTRNSLDYYAALQSKGVSGSLHIYPTGNHGWGFRDDFIYKPQWTAELAQWLRTLL